MRLRSLMILSVLSVPAMGAEPEAGSDLSKIQGCWEGRPGWSSSPPSNEGFGLAITGSG